MANNYTDQTSLDTSENHPLLKSTESGGVHTPHIIVDTLPASTQRTPGLTIETGSTNSPVVAGKKSVTFIFSSDFAGTLLTKTIDPAKISQISFDAGSDTLGAFAYTVTAGSLTIATLI